MDKEELKKYSLDPTRMQRYILEKLETDSNGTNIISDPTNPFILLLEAVTNTASNNLIETKALIRKIYPNLAYQPDELFHHLTDGEMVNMVSIPSEALMTFYVSLPDLKVKGYRPDKANYTETTLPIGSEVTIIGTTFTLLNDIIIRLTDTGNITVEQQSNDNPFAYQNTGILDHHIQHDGNGSPMIVFHVKMKQVKKVSKIVALTPSTGFKDIINLTDKYAFSEIKYKNQRTNNEYVYLPKSFNDEYIDPFKPTAVVNIYDKSIEVKIPDIYLINRDISGTLSIEIYETKGNIYLPINKYLPTDYNFQRGNISKNKSSASSANILVWTRSLLPLNGGVDGLTVNDLKDYIINNTTGEIELPVTEKQLLRYGEINGYKISKALDVVTDRQYIATKPLPEFNSELLYARQDVIFNTLEVSLNDIKTNKQIINLDNKSIIKSNSVFRIINGKMYILSNDELVGLNNLSGLALINKLKDVKYYYTPYYYIINHDENISTVNVYDLDNPKITSNRILNKNNSFTLRVNINKYSMYKIDTGYRFVFTVSGSSDYNENIDFQYKGFQVKVLLDNNITYSHVEAKYDDYNQLWYADIESDLNISDDTIDMKNGESDLFTKRFKLNTTIQLISYITHPAIKDSTDFLKNELRITDPTKNYVVLTKEDLTVEFGKELKYIWNKIYSVYTERKYLKYQTDVPMIYTENVYSKDPVTGAEITVTNNTLKYNILHRKGDIVTDKNGDTVYLHRKGDVVTDENGNPIIDQIDGVIRFVDIMLLEYEFSKATSNAYKQYSKLMLEALIKYIDTELKDINDLLLEKTEILYKSNKQLSDVIVNINNNLYTTPCVVKPVVTLYYKGATRFSALEIDLLQVTIGNILNKHFEKDVLSYIDIKNDTISALGEDVTSLKIEGIEPTNSEILNIEASTNRFILSKKLDTNNNNDLVVKYDFTLNIVYL